MALTSGDVNIVGPFTMPLTESTGSEIGALYNSTNDQFIPVITADKQLHVMVITGSAA